MKMTSLAGFQFKVGICWRQTVSLDTIGWAGIPSLYVHTHRDMIPTFAIVGAIGSKIFLISRLVSASGDNNCAPTTLLGIVLPSARLVLVWICVFVCSISKCVLLKHTTCVNV